MCPWSYAVVSTSTSTSRVFGAFTLLATDSVVTRTSGCLYSAIAILLFLEAHLETQSHHHITAKQKTHLPASLAVGPKTSAESRSSCSASPRQKTHTYSRDSST